VKSLDSRGRLRVPGVRVLHARLHVHVSALAMAALLLAGTLARSSGRVGRPC